MFASSQFNDRWINGSHARPLFAARSAAIRSRTKVSAGVTGPMPSTGVAAIALHGRTVVQAYSGEADWDAIGALVEHVDIPVLGNGDIWEAADALRMVEQTGVAGVVVGRGCLGRPWLFRDLAAAFAGESVATLPRLGEVAAMMRRHAELLSEHMGEERGCKEYRKHITWYLKGFPAGGELRHRPGSP